VAVLDVCGGAVVVEGRDPERAAHGYGLAFNVSAVTASPRRRQ
jgi:hypothetical protein